MKLSALYDSIRIEFFGKDVCALVIKLGVFRVKADAALIETAESRVRTKKADTLESILMNAVKL